MTANLPINLTWNNLSAYVGTQSLLTDCSGYCKAGEMLAIMGPSGAGKTTLLSLLTHRPTPSLQIQGEVQANRKKFSEQNFFGFGCFVYQNDLLHENLTVRQTLSFAAILRYGSEYAIQRVQQLLKQFQLHKCADSLVGGLRIKGISGGQKKRLSIAIEMVGKPSLIVLDEPTSGLDSHKARKVILLLRKLASKGKTIIFTIHQPSYLIYSQLDRLIVLNSGKTIYQGWAAGVQSYLASLGLKIPINRTISDYFMMEISEYKRDLEDYKTPFDVENYTLRLIPQIKQQLQIQYQNYSQLPNGLTSKGRLFCFRWLFWRDWINYIRNPMRFGAMLMNAVMRFFLVGCLFYHEIPSRERILISPELYFQSIQSVAFINISSCLMSSMYAVSITLPLERQIFIKERDSRKYTPFPYFISKVLSQMLSVTVGTLIFASSAYWLNGYTNNAEHFMYFTFIMILMSIAGNSIGFLCSTLFQQIGRVTALTPIVLIPLLVVSGMFNKLSAFPKWASWLQYVSPFRYGYQLTMQNEYGAELFGSYDYRDDLKVEFSFQDNLLIVAAITTLFYSLAFLFLKIRPGKIAT